MTGLIKITLTLFMITGGFSVKLRPLCERAVICNSKLLHNVQMKRIYQDSKVFVDLKMKYEEKTILSQFDELLQETDNTPSKEQIQDFVNTHFENATELENWTPTDYNPNPEFLAHINESQFRQFAKDINDIWPKLGRKVKSIVFEEPQLYSIIPVSHGFIIPGGRFKELYYWDTYWIIKGLLVCDMTDTVKGVIKNLVELLRKLGHIPNGARWYYQERSQPPLLSPMVKLYLQATNDTAFLSEIIDSLENEAKYWLKTHSKTFNVNRKKYTLLRYYAPSEGPRSEGYYEDYTNAQVFPTEELRREFYVAIKSGAESGWDFSTRWFIDQDGKNNGNISQIHTPNIIPVDLNSIFAGVLRCLSEFNVMLEHPQKAAYWGDLYFKWHLSIRDVFWNNKDGIWYDWDFKNKHHRKYFYTSNIAPLWMKVVDKSFMKIKRRKIINYLIKSHALDYLGGVPSSLIRSGEQWDFPNAWPPLVSMLVGALESLETKEASDLAFTLAQYWVRANHKGYRDTMAMFEKYNVEIPGTTGVGGEYEVQFGFGWTNGVALEFLSTYGPRLKILSGTQYV